MMLDNITGITKGSYTGTNAPTNTPTNTSTNTSTKSTNISTDTSADRPRGEWIHTPNGIDRDFVWWTCSECGHKIFSETEKDRREFHAYCGRCGADMRGDMRSE